MKFEAFFFDFDGVIVDSVDIKTRAFASLFEKYGKEIQEKIIEHNVQNGGIPRRNKFKYFYQNFLHHKLDEEQLHNLCSAFSTLVVDAIVTAPEIPGFRKFIRKWHKKVPCFVISATPDTEIIDIIQRRKIAKYFVQTLGSCQSKTDHLISLINKYKIIPEKCIFFGDSSKDYEAACACNVPFIGLIQNEKSVLLKVSPKIQCIKNFENLNSLNLHKFQNLPHTH